MNFSTTKLLKSKAQLGRGKRNSSRRTSSKRNRAKQEGILIHLNRAENLPAADSNGLSDPFVRFRVGKDKARSFTVEKTLNPSWQEDIFMSISKDNKEPLKIEVWDWDLIGSNDYLGEAEVDIGKIDWEEPIEFEVDLHNKRGKGGHTEAGTIFFTVKRARASDIKRANAKWVVTEDDPVAKQLIVDVVEAKDLLAMDSNGKSDPFVKLEYDGKKYKTKKIRYTTKPKWKESFDFLYDRDNADQTLTIAVFDWDRLSQSDFMGSAEIDLERLAFKNGLVNDIWVPLKHKNAEEGEAGWVRLLLRVIDVLKDNRISKRIQAKYKGNVKAHIVQALKPRGKSKKVCYAEVQVANNKLRTQPVEDTDNPVFERIVSVPVKDIFGTIEISLFERDAKYSDPPKLIGRISRPLLSISNGDTEWYVLKNSKLEKAVNAQIQIAFNFDYQMSGYLGLIGRKDANLMVQPEVGSIKETLHQMGRVSKLKNDVMGLVKNVNTLLNWGYGPQPSIVGMIIGGLYFLLFRAFFIPFTLLVGLMYNYFNHYNGYPISVNEEGEAESLEVADFKLDDDDEEVEDPVDKSGGETKKHKMDILEKANMPLRISKTIQTLAQNVADMGERFENLVNWTRPAVTLVVCLLLAVVTVVMMIIPLNVLVFLGLEFQFVKRGLRKYGYAFVRKPHHVPFEPPVELLKRIPTNEERKQQARVIASEETEGQIMMASYTSTKMLTA